MVIAPGMTTTYNDISSDKINATKMTLSILSLPYVSKYMWWHKFRGVNNDTLGQWSIIHES
jgi:hypothetical protein